MQKKFFGANAPISSPPKPDLMATPLCKWCMKKSRFSTITAGWSRAITIWTVHYSLSHKSRRPCWRYKQYPVMKGTAAHQWILFMTQANEATSKTNCPKNHFDPLFGDLRRYRHQKGRNHIRDRALPSRKISRR